MTNTFYNYINDTLVSDIKIFGEMIGLKLDEEKSMIFIVVIISHMHIETLINGLLERYVKKPKDDPVLKRILDLNYESKRQLIEDILDLKNKYPQISKFIKDVNILRNSLVHLKKKNPNLEYNGNSIFVRSNFEQFRKDYLKTQTELFDLL